jgi:transcriptional regulator with XRE-family HTH domain
MPSPLAGPGTLPPATGPARAAPPGPAVRRHGLGTHLRALRQARSLRLEDAAARLDIVPSTLSRIETGKAPTRTSYLTALLDLYGVDDPEERARLTALAQDGQGTPWWAHAGPLLPEGTGPYLDLEAAAARIAIHATRTIPGLAQTHAYTAAATRLTRPGLTSDQIDIIATAHACRPRQLRPGRRLHLIIDQTALARPVAPAHIMARQYRHLTAIGAAPAVTLQVTTPASNPPVLTGSFTLLTFTDPAGQVTCHQAPAGRIIITRRPADTRTTLDTFRTLAAAALSPADSADLIAALADRQS